MNKIGLECSFKLFLYWLRRLTGSGKSWNVIRYISKVLDLKRGVYIFTILGANVWTLQRNLLQQWKLWTNLLSRLPVQLPYTFYSSYKVFIIFFKKGVYILTEVLVLLLSLSLLNTTYPILFYFNLQTGSQLLSLPMA